MNAFIKKPPRASRRPSAPGSKPKRTRVEQRDATRAGILDAARAHFEERGFEGANVRAIAAEAGVAAGTVLLHFTDKRDLLHAALFEDLERTADLAIRSTPQADLRAQLRHIARCFFDYYAARSALSRTLLEESLLAKPPWAGRFASQVARVHVHLARLVEEAKAAGTLDPSVDAPLLGVSFFSFYYFALIAWVQGAHPDPLALTDKLVAVHLQGLAPRPAPSLTVSPNKKGKPRAR